MVGNGFRSRSSASTKAPGKGWQDLLYFASFAAVFSGILLAIYGCLYRGAPTLIALEGALLATIGVWLALLYTHNLHPLAKWHDIIKASGLKAQSAMEYLMTYGWAILIIAVVLGALFSLGVFNSGTFATRAYPNQCRVFRPYGQSVATGEQLEGICNNEIPQSVAQFNGASSYITLSSSPSAGVTSGSSITISAWINPSAIASNKAIFSTGSGPGGIMFEQNNNQLQFFPNVFNGPSPSSGFSTGLSPNTWQFVAVTYNDNSGSATFYLNNQVYIFPISESPNYFGLTTYAAIGYYLVGNARYFQGSIADVQIYNTSLSANDVQALHKEGIGGEPILSDGLVGWWALNGNTNDTSGNLNNGQASGVGYTSFWTNGYAAP